MFEIVARELRAKLLGRQRGLADTTQQHSATGVEGAGGTGGHGCGGRGRWRGQGGLRDDALSHTQQHSTAGVEGTGGTGGSGGPGCGGRGRQRGLADTTQHRRHRRCGGRRRDRRARAGFEIDTSEPQARVWRSRGRPGPTAPRTPAAPQAPAGPGQSALTLRRRARGVPCS